MYGVRVAIDEALDRVEAQLQEEGQRVLSAVRGAVRAYTWYSPNGGNGFRIDQAFVNRQLRPRLRDVRYDWGRRVGRPSRRLSDHAALLVDLQSQMR